MSFERSKGLLVLSEHGAVAPKLTRALSAMTLQTLDRSEYFHPKEMSHLKGLYSFFDSSTASAGILFTWPTMWHVRSFHSILIYQARCKVSFSGTPPLNLMLQLAVAWTTRPPSSNSFHQLARQMAEPEEALHFLPL
ncbi:uncharacterized protein RAG0_15125 [Rhynchosporium agropyri]|uniref:Uncharacterized protein n=1 Tax=Rhynchosporium agropyri TaxID=914238 RepID=A0A1E1LJW4_9HELO|nr:uncharacterized protein RAG0_15125 [Rhynchosporium agropyri]